MQLLPYEKWKAAALTTRLSLKSKSSQYSIKEGVPTTHCHLVNHLSEMYATGDFIAEKGSEISCYVKQSPHGHWHLRMTFGSGCLDFPTFVTSMFSRESSLVDTCNPFAQYASIMEYPQTRNLANVLILRHVFHKTAGRNMLTGASSTDRLLKCL